MRLALLTLSVNFYLIGIIPINKDKVNANDNYFQLRASFKEFVK